MSRDALSCSLGHWFIKELFELSDDAKLKWYPSYGVGAAVNTLGDLEKLVDASGFYRSQRLVIP